MTHTSNAPPTDEQIEDLTLLLRRFDAAWRSGAAPDLSRFLPSAGKEWRREALVQLILVDLECRWRGLGATAASPKGFPERPLVEDYAAAYPEFGGADALPLEVIAEEYRARTLWGDRPEHAEFERRFPKRTSDLQKALRAVDREIDRETDRERQSEEIPSGGLDTWQVAADSRQNATQGRKGDSLTGVFAAPAVGSGSVPRTASELRAVLQQRLMVVLPVNLAIWCSILVLSLTGAGSLVREELAGRTTQWFCGLYALLLMICIAALWRHRQIAIERLRWIEGITLAGFMVCLSSFQLSSVQQAIDHHRENVAVGAYLLPALGLLSGFGWSSSILIYGLALPHSWRRVVMLVLLIAACPLTIDAALAIANWRDLSAMLEPAALQSLMLVASVALAWFGTYKLAVLERQVRRAHQEAQLARAIGPYELLKKIGSGGMGEVHLARHRLLKRPCAVKLIRPDRATDPRMLARFDREVQATARLRHPHTIEIFDYGHEKDGNFYYVMEYLDGLPLDRVVERTGPLGESRSMFILKQLCGALREAHAHGLIHRDIKPGNVFLCRQGGIFDFVKLLDFGLVRAAEGQAGASDASLDELIVGTPAYASSEQAAGEPVDARSDLYSLGCTAFFLLCGRPPFTGRTIIDVLHAHRSQKAPAIAEFRSDISPLLVQIVERCLEKDPAQRFADVQELEAALAGCPQAPPWTQQDAEIWWHAHIPLE